MIFLLVFGAASLLSGLFFMVLAIRGRTPKNLVSVTGELTQQKGYKNYKMKNYTIPNMTECTYTYTVNGKSYQLRSAKRTHPRNVRKRVSIVYLRGFPRCAYEEHFSGIIEWLLAVSLIVLGGFCILVSFMIT